MRALTVYLALLVSTLAQAQSYAGPMKLGYAGCATDASGAPYSGPQGVTLRLFDAPSGGTLLKSYDFSSSSALGTLQFTNGCFSVELDLASTAQGPAVSLGQMDKPLFLEITIAANVTYSRIPFDLVPYSAWAGAVHWADVRDRPSLVNTLSAGAGISLPDGGVGNVVVAVDFAQVQRILSLDGTCTGPNFVKTVNPATGVVSCAFPGAPNVTVGPGLLVGSDGGLNGGSASFSVTGGDLTFGLNLSPAGASTVTATILGDAGTADGGVIPLTTFNGSSPVVARADHLHPVHHWLGPNEFSWSDANDSVTPSRGRLVMSSMAAPQISYPVITLGSADSLSVMVALPEEFVPSRIVVRLSAACAGTSGSYQYDFGGTAPASCGYSITPALRFTALASPSALAQFNNTSGQSPLWTPVGFPPVGANSGVWTAQFAPVRVGYTQAFTYTSPPTPAKPGDLLYLQLYNSNYSVTVGGWEFSGLDVEFIP